MQYVLNGLGEFRMGAEGFGITLIFDDQRCDILSKTIVFCNVTQETVKGYFVYSADRKHVIIKGIFDTYVINVPNREIALFRITVHDSDVWSDESAIWGSNRRHVSGADGSHYYVQFPFVPFESFEAFRHKYETMRRQQISELTKLG